MKQYKNISNRRDNAIHMTQLKNEHLSGIMRVKEKIKQSIHERYGEEGLGNESITNKKKSTCIDKYGVDNPAKCDEVKEKIKSKMLDKYEVSCSFQSKEVIQKCKDSKFKELFIYNKMEYEK